MSVQAQINASARDSGYNNFIAESAKWFSGFGLTSLQNTFYERGFRTCLLGEQHKGLPDFTCLYAGRIFVVAVVQEYLITSIESCC
jgi:hypothetical protein